MKWHKILASIILPLPLVILAACSSSPSERPATDTAVKIAVTQNFGEKLIFEQSLNIKENTSALDALKQAAPVETSYGGGFVSGINGIRSRYAGGVTAREDWFFYVNGLISNVGASDYVLQPGDTEQWDFHSWSLHSFTPAVIGHFPEPFLHGYSGKTRPTVIVYTDKFREEAKNLERKLGELGAHAVGSKEFSALSPSEKENSNLILIGTPDVEAISELNRHWKQLGFFAYFADVNLAVLNASGAVANNYGSGAGLIQATQNPWNPNGIGAGENVVWLVSGTDETGVKAAIDALINRNTDLRYAHAAVIVSGEIVRIPR